MRKGAPLLACLLTAACHTEVQPIVIDLTAGRTPTAAPTPVAAAPTPVGTAVAPPAPAAAPALAPPPNASPSTPPPAAGSPVARAPEQIVQDRVAAYERGDLDALLSFYAEDAKIYDHPGRLTESGLAQIRQRYARRFSQTPRIRVRISGRMVQGSFVVDQEEVSGAPMGPVRRIAIYEVRDGKIANVWLIR